MIYINNVRRCDVIKKAASMATEKVKVIEINEYF